MINLTPRPVNWKLEGLKGAPENGVCWAIFCQSRLRWKTSDSSNFQYRRSVAAAANMHEHRVIAGGTGFDEVGSLIEIAVRVVAPR